MGLRTRKSGSQKDVAMMSAALVLMMTGCDGKASSNPVACQSGVRALAQDQGGLLPKESLQVSGAAFRGQRMRSLQGHVPSAVKGAQDQGQTGQEQELPVTVALELNHPDELAQRLVDLYRPDSADFHKFMTKEEFHSRYAPTQDQIAQVQSYLESQGLQSVTVDENRLLVRAIGKVSALNSAFHTEVHQYADPRGKSFHAPAYEMQIPEGLPIQGVHGLQNANHWHSYATKSELAASPRSSGTGPGGGLSPQDIRTAYNVPTGGGGSGQTLAVFELDGYNSSDIATHESYFGLPNVPLQNVYVDGASGSPGGGQAEVTLDIELMTALAPNASKILVYEGPNNEQGILDVYNKIASDNLAQAISTSWGSSENSTATSFLQSENSIFMQMAAQGQTIYSAAGDSGAYDDGSTLSVDDPSSQPYVVGVGGTLLSTASSGGYQSETTWNSGSSGGGGGISKAWAQPSWQNGIASSQNQASGSRRNVPDVALQSDIATGYSIFVSGSWATWGGTSCAAPLWAAFTALVNQQRAASGLGPLGFANPALYSLGKSGRYSSDFHDINDGSTNRYYPAVTGYDDATGWGSFNGANLLGDLSQEPTSSSVPTSALLSEGASCSG